jgi:hypothetical protein
MRHVSSRLAARAGIRQVEAVLKAEAAANAVDRAIAGVWRKILDLLARKPHQHLAYNEALKVAHELHPTSVAATADSLTRIAHWGHKSARADLLQTLPTDYLLVGAAYALHNRSRRLPGSGVHGLDDRRLGDSHLARSAIESALSQLGRSGSEPGLDSLAQLTEADLPVEPTRDQPGALELILNQFGLHPNDLLAPLREPVAGKLSDEKKRELFGQLLFPAPSLEKVASIVYGKSGGVDWITRLTSATKLAAPQRIAHVLSTGIAAGKTQRDIGKDLLPIVQGVQNTARRIARTEGMRVAGAMQQEMHEQLGDLVIGYQIHATLDAYTRSWHAARHGRIYYLHPENGQPGPAQMPHPPEEAQDASQRPVGTPFIAWH